MYYSHTFIEGISCHISLPTQLGEVLHTQLMSLVGRLHDGELDRQSLCSQLTESRAECEQLSSTCTELCGLREQVEALQREVR